MEKVDRPITALVQQYITNPLLMDGKKFHLRLYLVIANVSPLRLLAFKEGLLLTAAKNFTTDPQHYQDLQVHLSNSAMSNGTVTPHTSKTVSQFWDWLAHQHSTHKNDKVPSQSELWRRISNVLGKVGFSSQVHHDVPVSANFKRAVERGDLHRSSSCFDVFGADIMFDNDFNPILLELNNGPELYTQDPISKPVNHLVHTRLLQELVPLLAMSRTPPNGRSIKFESMLAEFLTTEVTKDGDFVPIQLRKCRDTGDSNHVTDGCVSGEDVVLLWQFFDQVEDIVLFC